jgi:outer membrane OmpH-like protein
MKISVCISCLLVTLLLQAPLHGWAQEKQHLTPLNYQKIASIDADRIRKEYVAYAAAKEKMHKETVEKKKSFDEATHAIEKQTKEQLKKDSIHKLQQKQLIADKSATSRAELQNQFTAGIKQRNADRMALTKNYEDKIREAIHIIMREGAFTELKSSKDSTASTGIDITDKVLQKLNQNQ